MHAVNSLTNRALHGINCLTLSLLFEITLEIGFTIELLLYKRGPNGEFWPNRWEYLFVTGSNALFPVLLIREALNHGGSV